MLDGWTVGPFGLVLLYQKVCRWSWVYFLQRSVSRDFPMRPRSDGLFCFCTANVVNPEFEICAQILDALNALLFVFDVNPLSR